MSTPPSARRRVLDASMELLSSIQRETVDPEYAQLAADPGQRPRRAPLLVLLVGLVAGLMFATSGLGAGRGSAGVVSERADLIAQVSAAEQRNAELRQQLTELDAEIATIGGSRAAEPDLDSAVWAGTTAVTGPGVLLVLNDNPADTNGILVDQDLRQVINGLWQAGAEAIAINGHRLSARTAIRQAGSAITVDYRSMTTPYRIQVIGDPTELVNGFNTNSGGKWLTFLRRNYGVSWSIDTQQRLEIGSDAGLDIDRARVP